MPNQYREAKAPEKTEKRGEYKKLHHIEIEPIKGEHGGHIVTHHFQNEMGGKYRAPEVHMFGKDGKSSDGKNLFEHVSKHLKIPLPTVEPGDTHEGEKEEREGPKSRYQAAAEPIEEDVEA
jgi:hypothetical protein